MNYCPECGVKLSDDDRKSGCCSKLHGLAPVVDVARRMDVGPPRGVRKLPENDEERAEAYISALARLESFFKLSGYQSYVSEGGTLMVGKGRFLLDAKIVPNDGRTAYVTSGPGYNPLKAGTKDSGATVITSRTVMKASNLLRITVSSAQTANPVFVELRKNIQDPELHICKSVLFVLQDALDKKTALYATLQDVRHLRDVPPEWLPKPGDWDELFGLPADAHILLEPPK